MAEKKKPTQEEIIQEVGEVSSNWNPNDKPAMQDPIVWREDYKTEDIINGRDPKLIKNWSMNKDAYWDDGNGVNNVDIPEMYWGKNDKYMGEWTRNTFEAYDPNLTTAGLDPNYKYWVNARMANSAEANYIARRNDMIASALYNEWRTSMQDVADFLNAQEGFRNSTEWERQNTIASIWKRIWEKGQWWEKEEAKKEESDLSKAEDIISDTSWKLYWKTTANGWDPVKWINTLSDENSVFKSMEEDRVRNLKEFVSMDPHTIAVAQLSNSGAITEQTIRDAEQYYPEFMAQVKAEKKRIIAQENATAIAKGWEITTVADKVNTNTELTSYAVNNATSTTSATQLLQSIDSILESNDTAKSAQELMGSIEKDMATLKNRLKNLREEVKADFKWDVPDYIVNAAMNNRSQEIQNQLSILEDRYNAAYNRYKAEVGNAQWEKEYELKEKELKLKESSLALDEWKAKNWTTWTTSTTNKNYTVAERNNNPLNMTVDFMKIVWAELGVDYEVSSDSFVNSKWWTQYYAKLIGDPIETTIRVLDKALKNGVNPFTTTSRSYINKLWLTKEKWLKMSHDEKVEMIKKWLPYEWWSMENMAYYLEQKWWDSYIEEYAPYYQKLLDADYTAISWPEKTAQDLGYSSVADFRKAAFAWKAAQDKRISEEAKNKPSKWIRKDWQEFDMSDTPTYDTLTYDQKNIVQQLLNLNKNPATITKRQYWDDFEKILSAVKEINPNWSDSDFWQADKVKKEWNTSSKNGSNSRNGTAIATAMDIYDIADEFGNMRWKSWNEMLNKFRDKFSDEEYTKLLINLEVLASEYAWALKGNNAAPTEQEIQDKKEILAVNLWAGAMKEATIQVARTLYNKNANEADNYFYATLQKPPLIVTQDVADWMYNVAWIKSLPDRYNYTPSQSTTSTWPKAPKIDVSQYRWRSIWDALDS